MLPALTIFVVYAMLTIPAAIVGIPWTLLTGDISLVYGWAMRIMRLGTRAAGIRIEAERRTPLDPAQRYLFLSNHISNLDPPILLPLLPGRVSVFIKRSLTRLPILGYGMKLANFIPVDRDGRVESAKASVEAAAQVMASGVDVLSFVEGTRSRNGRLLPFKKGPFYLAMETGVPVVPVSISGTESMMKKGSVRLYPGTARIVFHAPVYPGDYATREELMEAVRSAIASGLPKWMRGEDTPQ
ncbi:lysophospholipid acyltransferase family protein [Silvibacterium dinghuense]|uniref:1-acyl-sn-glycerol-3-phosphate acyltransferase n=1 Tax=Silvibacterium dinghuense TaxID=1560006 RepID=A0A4Q1SC01_9BACT|nr:lysophospholipid acyltransferase family protein [Silvibacterium dinghuense]RXS94360.1 1-acyl-sn-glycerol-3-phosphate acyltransferase [Silvibacterium dinghuense]GGH16635.1 1-acyl-sn-glycerol-3-phosphate acyltransferase [Silvibacterium dinghuense]